MLRAAFALLLCLVAGPVAAGAIDDANGAVRAAQAGDYGEAVRLFTSALDSGELTENGQAQALSYRGIALAAQASFRAAEADLDAAVALGSGYGADAFANRGFFKMVTGRASEAATDLTASARLRVWPYNALWLHFARLKAGLPDSDGISLSANASILDRSRWPGPLLDYLAGHGSEEAVRAAAAANPGLDVSRACDADFYIAENTLAKGDAQAARALFQRAADQCPFGAFERMGAAAELMHLPQ